MNKLLPNFNRWPIEDYWPRAKTYDEKVTTMNGRTDDDDGASSDHNSKEVHKVSDFCALMHESGVIQNSPIAFFTASPKVCGEAAIFAKGDKEQVSRD